MFFYDICTVTVAKIYVEYAYKKSTRTLQNVAISFLGYDRARN